MDIAGTVELGVGQRGLAQVSLHLFPCPAMIS